MKKHTVVHKGMMGTPRFATTYTKTSKYEVDRLFRTVTKSDCNGVSSSIKLSQDEITGIYKRYFEKWKAPEDISDTFRFAMEYADKHDVSDMISAATTGFTMVGKERNQPTDEFQLVWFPFDVMKFIINELMSVVL